MHRPQPRGTLAPYRDPEAALRGRSSKLIPESGLLLSITGLGVMLAGFSGLVGAFRGSTTLKPMDAYRLRQIPDVGAHARIRTGDLFLTKEHLCLFGGCEAILISIGGCSAQNLSKGSFTYETRSCPNRAIPSLKSLCMGPPSWAVPQAMWKPD